MLCLRRRITGMVRHLRPLNISRSYSEEVQLSHSEQRLFEKLTTRFKPAELVVEDVSGT